jgi:hypothetical protein
MERREFLLTAGGATIGLLAGCTAESTPHRHSPSRSPQATPKPLTEQQRRIMRFEESSLQSRASLGLRGFSAQAIVAQELQNEEWTVDPQPLHIDVPVELTSYGKLFEYFSDQHLTPQTARRLIRGIGVNPSLPNENRWLGDSRMFNVSKSMTRFWTQANVLGWSVYGLYYHELLGHVPDPVYSTSLYPQSIFWPVEAGKWQMLAEVDKIHGPLVDGNGNWTLNASFPTDIGETIAKDYVEGKDLSARFTTGADRVSDLAAEVAIESGKTVDTLRFNKYRSFLMGEKVLEQIHTGSFAFSDSMQEKYNDFLSKAFIEIFPEMMRGVFVHPDFVNNNPSILSGAQQVISALRQDNVPIEKLRQIAKNTPRDIEQLWREEREQFSKAPVYSSSQPDPLQKRVEDLYPKVVEKGANALPTEFSLGKTDLDLWREHLDMVQSVCRVYYNLSNLDPNNLRGSFDPNLPIWHIREVENALDPDFIQTFLAKGFRAIKEPLDDEERKKLIIKTAILRGFRSSDAFGT